MADLAESNSILSILTELGGSWPFAVRGILFDKTSESNWSVTWHQDLTIAVKGRFDIAGFSGWSIKAGVVHVHAPTERLARMLTLRVHLDDADETNGALRVIAGSHRSGKMSETAIKRVVTESETVCCTARAGDGLVMRPLLLHASSPASSPAHRRVIHIEFAVDSLPAPLEWIEQRA